MALTKMISNETRLEELKAQLALVDKYHPDRLQALQLQTDSAIESANRWTGILNLTLTSKILDNVFQVTSWMKEKFGVEESILTKQFRIPENFDYVEL